MLKSDLHLHCKGDPEDTYIEDSAKEYIDYACTRGFKVLSFTTHGAVFDITPFKRHARKKGIVLIPGAEAFIEGKDILLYNFTQRQVEKIKNFEDLRVMKKKKHLVVAPHPFYPHLEPPKFKNRSLNKLLLENIDLFDGVEFCHFYTRYLGFNKKAVKTAKKYKIALIGNSDAHTPSQMNSTYSLIRAKPNVSDIIKAVKQRKVEVVSVPRSTRHLLKIFFGHARHLLPKTL